MSSFHFPYRLCLVVLLLSALWLASREMVSDPIWYDEYWSLYYAGAAPQYGPVGLAETWSRVGSVDHELNPPGYYLLLNVWGHLVGWVPFTVRVLSALAGLLAIAWVYRLGYDLSGRVAGMAAAAALAVSSYYIHYMHEIRAYVFMPLLVIMTLWAYWQFMRRGTWQMAMLLMFSLASLLYVHYMGFPFILAAGVYHLLVARKNRYWLLTLLPIIGGGVLFLPWVQVAMSALNYVSTDATRTFFADDPLPLISNTLSAFGNGSATLLAVFGWYALRRRGAVLVGFFLIATLICALLLNELFQFISGPHYLLALLPFLILTIGLGAAQMARLRLRPIVLMAVWVVAGGWLILRPDGLAYSADGDGWQLTLPWDTFAAALRPYVHPYDTVIYLLPEPVPHWVHAPVAAYYLYDLPAQVEPMPPFVAPPLSLPVDQTLRLHLIESLTDKTPADYQQEAAGLLHDIDYVWVGYNPAHLPPPFTRPALDTALSEQNFMVCEQVVATAELSLTLLARQTRDEAGLYFGEGIDLQLLTPMPEKAHNPLFLILGWTLADSVSRGTYSVALHLENEQGQLVAQADKGLPSETHACQPVSISLDDLPQGKYILRAIVYNWQTGERLLAEVDESLVVGRFTIGS